MDQHLPGRLVAAGQHWPLRLLGSRRLHGRGDRRPVSRRRGPDLGGVKDYGDFGAIAAGGSPVVFERDRSPHETDLGAIRRDGEAWGEPAILTGDSPHPYNGWPALSADASTLVFNCRYSVRPGEHRICRVGVDDTILFEADWQGSENMWRIVPGATPALITQQFPNDNSLCVLPDGGTASLWLGRSEGDGHELKVMAADGRDHVTLVVNNDVMDIGLGCGAG